MTTRAHRITRAVVARAIVALSVVSLSVVVLAACELLAPPEQSSFGDACGPDLPCADELACIDGLCRPGSAPDDDAGVQDGG